MAKSIARSLDELVHAQLPVVVQVLQNVLEFLEHLIRGSHNLDYNNTLPIYWAV